MLDPDILLARLPFFGSIVNCRDTGIGRLVAGLAGFQEFDSLAARVRLLGFRKVVAGPFVRSSYHADDMVTA